MVLGIEEFNSRNVTSPFLDLSLPVMPVMCSETQSHHLFPVQYVIFLTHRHIQRHRFLLESTSRIMVMGTLSKQNIRNVASQ